MAYFDGVGLTLGFGIEFSRSMSLIHCPGLRIAAICLPSFLFCAEQRVEADVDVVVVVGQRERVVRAAEGHQAR